MIPSRFAARKRSWPRSTSRGCVDGLPFMPEMFQFCGRRFRVRAVAHKTCDTARQNMEESASSSHGAPGGSSLRWFRPRRMRGRMHAVLERRVAQAGRQECRAQLTNGKPHSQFICVQRRAARSRTHNCRSISVDDEPCYSCQATKLYDATEPLAWWDLRQYVLDVVTGNHSAGRVLRVMWLALLRSAVAGDSTHPDAPSALRTI